jgi:hypothetical protein
MGTLSYQTVILYWSENLAVILRQERRLSVFENSVLRRIFGPKRDEVTGGWRKSHNDELHGLNFSPNIIRTGFKRNRIEFY